MLRGVTAALWSYVPKTITKWFLTDLAVFVSAAWVKLILGICKDEFLSNYFFYRLPQPKKKVLIKDWGTFCLPSLKNSLITSAGVSLLLEIFYVKNTATT